MKICKVSRKSLLIYVFVFFFMLFFEANRINPVLERESIQYPFLRPVQEFLQSAGTKSGLYALSERMHAEINAVSEYMSEPQALAPLAATWLEQNFGKANLLAQHAPQPDTLNMQAEKIVEKETGQPQTAAAMDGTQKNNSETFDSPAAQNNVSKTAEPANNAPVQSPYTYNALGYPFRENLVQKSTSPYGIDCYAAVLPDYGRKKTVLLIGDSMMMEGLGPTLHHRLRKRDNLDVYREGRYSSGLSRPDFYDWPKNLTVLLEKYNPDLLIMSLGANDTQDIVIDKKRYFIDTKEWAELYLQRSKDFIALADNGKRHILWVSLPVMGKEPYFTRTRLISKLQEEASKTVDRASFVNIEHLLTENGKYTTFYKDKNNQSIRLRSQDLIHVSNAGGEILTDYVLPHADKHLNALYAEDVPQSYPPAAGYASRVSFYSPLRQKQSQYYIWLPQTNTEIEKPQAPLNVQKTIKQQLAGKNYPVLYLLHGAAGSGKDYADNLGKSLQELADSQKIIIVAPDCEPFGWYVNSPYIAENQIYDHIIKELIPHVDTLYPTNGKRALAGLSMGGHGALLLGFQNKSLFQSMASISGVLDIREHKDSWKIKNLLGTLEENPKLWEDNSVYALIGKKWPATSPKKIIVVAGTEDKLIIEENRKAKELFHKRGFSIDYTEAKGTHSWEFWCEHIPQVLKKQAEYLNSL